jgi:hypothetical protein
MFFIEILSYCDVLSISADNWLLAPACEGPNLDGIYSWSFLRNCARSDIRPRSKPLTMGVAGLRLASMAALRRFPDRGQQVVIADGKGVDRE